METPGKDRDFSAVSPSARWMIHWKGHTTIPYAREVAELLEYPNSYIPDFKKRDYTFWASTLGLEKRYRSIDQLLNELPVKNVLELSSGYSFRSLHFALREGVYYIDTDLPEIIATKQEFLDKLKTTETNIQGKLELLPLNVLDEAAFREIASRFPEGELIIVNEGLLSYLNLQEKEQFCAIVHSILKERGGYWITADIQIRNTHAKVGVKYNDKIREFNEQQHTEENNFESVEAAKQFFNRMGFEIEKESNVKYSEMSSFKYFLKSMSLIQMFKMRKVGVLQATWRLRAV